MELKQICLANLESSSEQEVFDWIAHNLLTQNERSGAEFEGVVTCAYRGENGRKCAAGWCIANSEYDQNFENTIWNVLAMDGKVPKAHESLISSMQCIHDSIPVHLWKDKLRDYTVSYNLDAKVLDNFQ